MAKEPDNRILVPVAAPQETVPLHPREVRAQAVQRLQVGLFGLAAMVLLVTLANIIMDRARQADADAAPSVLIGEGAASKPAGDPLADIGVVPAAGASAAAEPDDQPAASDTGN